MARSTTGTDEARLRSLAIEDGTTWPEKANMFTARAVLRSLAVEHIGGPNATPFPATFGAVEGAAFDFDLTFNHDNGQNITITQLSAPPVWVTETHGGSPVSWPQTNVAVPWAVKFTGTAPLGKNTYSWSYQLSDSFGVTQIVDVSIEVVVYPSADAGTDQNVNALATVNLDGTGSTDPNGGGIISWAWTQTGGSAVVLNNADTATPDFTAPNHTETLTFQLEVENSVNLKDTDSVDVNVTNHPPTDPNITSPTAGQRFHANDIITMTWDASTDPDGMPSEDLTYNVQISPDNGATWIDYLTTGAGILTADIDMSDIPSTGLGVLLAVRAYDGDLYSNFSTVQPSFIMDVTAISTDPSSPFTVGNPVQLQATVTDRDNPIAPGCSSRYYWSETGLPADKVLLGTALSDEWFEWDTTGYAATEVGKFFVDANDGGGWSDLWESTSFYVLQEISKTIQSNTRISSFSAPPSGIDPLASEIGTKLWRFKN